MKQKNQILMQSNFKKEILTSFIQKKLLDTPRESVWGTTTREQKMGLEFKEDEYNEIDEYCKKKQIKMVCITLGY